MRTTITVLSVTLTLLLPIAARADLLKLANGGELSGTLEEVTIVAAGRETTCGATTISSLRLSETGRDALELKDGTKLNGELISIKLRTIAGLMTFKRKDLAAITLTPDPLAATRAELADKQAKIKPGDATALCELAQWCIDKGLKTEAAQLARASLQADPDAECAEKAHKLLRDVFYENEWMPPIEALKREEAKIDTIQTSKQPYETNLTPEEIQAIKSALAENEELFKTYLERAREKATGSSSRCEDAVRLAYLKNKRVLLTGKLIPVQQLTALYDDLLATQLAQAPPSPPTRPQPTLLPPPITPPRPIIAPPRPVVVRPPAICPKPGGG